MPFFTPNQTNQQLRQYLNRRHSQSSSHQVNDFFTKSQKKHPLYHPNVKSKRFNTTPSLNCQIDFRIKTFYQPSKQYKFTGQCFKKKFSNRNSLRLMNPSNDFYESNPPENQEINLLTVNVNQKPEATDLAQEKTQQKTLQGNNRLTKSLLFQKQSSPSQIQNQHKSPPKIKFQVKHPTPVKETQFLIKLKQRFLKKYSKQSKSKKYDLIKIQDYVTEQKQTFKRKMQSQLIRSGEAHLLSQIKQNEKGKIYLAGLHNIKKKRKNVENIDELLQKSRESFSTQNMLISHLKLASQKEHKLETIKQLNQKNMQNCLQKIKSLNLRRQVVSHSVHQM